MRVIDALGLLLSVIGLHDIIFYFLRFFLPRYRIPPIEALLGNTQQFLRTHADTVHAIPGGNELRTGLDTLTNQLTRMRLESNRSLGIFHQVWLAIRHCLSFRALSSQIESIRVTAEMAVDEEQLALFDAPGPQSADSTESAAPAADTATPIGDVAEPIPPPLAHVS